MTLRADPQAIPELGPLLGRLVGSPPAERAPADAALERVRLDLLTELFEQGGKARAAAAAGDGEAARAALGGGVWLGAWQRAVDAAARAIGAERERALREAAARSRYPARRLARELPDDEAGRLLAARLSAAGIGLEEAAERLADPALPWLESLRRTGGELEAAWEGLRTTARGELAEWERRAARIAAWRPAWRPVLIAGGLLLALATWLGLVLGGYLAVPAWLRPLTDWVWSL